MTVLRSNKRRLKDEDNEIEIKIDTKERTGVQSGCISKQTNDEADLEKMNNEKTMLSGRY